MSKPIDIPLLQIALGIAILYGDGASRTFMMDIVRFFLYVHCKFALWIFTFFASSMEKNIYEEVTHVFQILPYKIAPHFHLHPELYILCGWLILISAFATIVRQSFRCV